MNAQSVLGYVLIAAGVGQLILQSDWIGVPWPLWVCGLAGAGVVMVWTDKRGNRIKDGTDALEDSSFDVD